MDPQAPGPPRTVFSPDGMWWWDDSQWRPALSPDGFWRWDGRAWVPARPAAQPRAGGGGAGTAIAITVVVFVAVLVLVTILTVVVLLTMSNQIANVFSNVAGALSSP